MGKLHTLSEVIGIIRDLLLIVVFIGCIVFIFTLISLAQAAMPLISQANALFGGSNSGNGFLPIANNNISDLPLPIGGNIENAANSVSPEYKASVSEIINAAMANDYDTASQKLLELKNECQQKENTECVQKIEEIEKAAAEGNTAQVLTLFTELEATLK